MPQLLANISYFQLAIEGDNPWTLATTLRTNAPVGSPNVSLNKHSILAHQQQLLWKS